MRDTHGGKCPCLLHGFEAARSADGEHDSLRQSAETLTRDHGATTIRATPVLQHVMASSLPVLKAGDESPLEAVLGDQVLKSRLGRDQYLHLRTFLDGAGLPRQ